MQERERELKEGAGVQLDQSEATGKDGSLVACEAEGRREIDKQAGQAGKQAGVQVGMQ